MGTVKRDKQWFDDVNVPTRSYNKSLGLKNIKVYPPTPRQQAYDIECTCVLFLVCGTITVSIAESRQGTYYIIPPGQI
ncbi:hypothetical protein ACFX4N_23855 [Priestia sp. YIM B13551]|uniref:hypothetical protein n=1 Tax=Priestia sp. YIM B13551 TaxID=3366306 RepID=UPI0036708EFB